MHTVSKGLRRLINDLRDDNDLFILDSPWPGPDHHAYAIQRTKVTTSLSAHAQQLAQSTTTQEPVD